VSARILAVLSDPESLESLSALLRSAHYVVDTTTRGGDVAKQFSCSQRPELVIVGHQLEDMPGTQVCRQVRGFSTVPLIILSTRDEDIDRVVAFEVGADDYITTPFHPRELLLRIAAILRRCYARVDFGRQLQIGTLRLDRDSHRVWLCGTAIELTSTEFRLLELLMLRSGRPQSRAQLLDEVRRGRASASLRTVDTHMRRLREKLGPASAYIRTVRGVGYCYRVHGQAME
jgi:two-component system, OmpR family, phosphate regulon response regulator PhoB